MRFIGFIKEYNCIEGAIKFEEINQKQNLPKKQIDKIVRYLNKGKLITTVLSLFLDMETSESISTGAYLTDGEYIWPSYFPYYLVKTNSMYADSSFLSYLEQKDYLFNERLQLPEDIEDIFFEIYDKLELSS